MLNKSFALLCLSTVCLLSSDATSFGQGSDAMSVLKKDVGNWDCEIKFYADPNGDPSISKGTETNSAIGDKWVIGEFKGEMAGVAFHGASQMGYDPSKKKYVGSWVDSASPFATQMEGTYDAATKSLTLIGIGKEPSGNEMKTKLVTTYKDDDNRTMTMYMPGPGGDNAWFKLMEVIYRRRK